MRLVPSLSTVTRLGRRRASFWHLTLLIRSMLFFVNRREVVFHARREYLTISKRTRTYLGLEIYHF